MGDNQETQYCSNCKRDIACTNFVMHEVHCRRNIILCRHCKEPVPRTEIDDHYEEYHAEIACDLCNATVEKQKLDDHKDECPKRQSKCAYCEIDLPFCDLKDHLQYCGTRTEPCTKCGQFVMHKDLHRHEDSNCTYPQPKASNANAAASTNTGINNRTDARPAPSVARERHAPTTYNNFAMDELERILNDPSVSGTSSSRGAAIPRVSNPLRANARAGSRNTGVTGTKRTTVKKTQNTSQRNTNSTPNGGIAQRSSHQPDGQDDMDHLLAMHLAHDLNDEDITANADQNYNLLPSDVNSSAPDGGTSSLEQTVLPCEFCGDPLPIDVLIQHQATCLGGDGITVPNINVDPSPNPYSADLPNNSPIRAQHTPSEPAREPAIVDNLSYLAAHDWLSNPSEEFAGDILLPCEFCDVLFPEDLLIQHQAVCDAGNSRTPRMTPATRSAPRRTPNRSRDAGAAARGVAPPSNRLNRRQNDPGFMFLGSEAGSASPTVRPRPSLPKSRAKQPTAQRRHPEPRGPIHANRGASTNTHGAKRGAGGGRAAGHDDGSIPSRRRQGSAARVQDTLEHFIEDPMDTGSERPWSSSTFTVEMDKEEKGTKNSRIQQKDRDKNGPPHRGRDENFSQRNHGTTTSSYTASFSGASTRPTGGRRPKPVTRTNFNPGLGNDDRLRVRNGSSESTAPNSQTKKRGSGRRGRQGEDV